MKEEVYVLVGTKKDLLDEAEEPKSYDKQSF